MSVLTEALGGTHEFIHKGKVYRVSLITQAIKAAYEDRLFAKAKEAALAMRQLMPREDYQAHLRQLNDDYIKGEYAFESARGLEVMQKVPGTVMLCSLLFGIDEMEVLKLVQERQEEVTSLLQLIIKESFPQGEEGETVEFDPNGQRPGEDSTRPS